MIERIDDLSRPIRLETPAQRIVCLVPSITETLFALGADERIAGVTDYCIHPEIRVRSKTKVGGTKNFFTGKILALEPDLVVANAEENQQHPIEKLEQAGLTVFVTFPRTVDGCLKMISDMAALTGTESAAQPMLAAIEAERTKALAAAVKPRPRVLCPIWKGPYMTINHDTFVDSVIQCCGGQNVFRDSAERYPQFTLEEASRRQPDVVLLPTEPYHFTAADIPGFNEMGKEVPAVRNQRIHIVEGELLSWYGPRLSRALAEVSALLRSSVVSNESSLSFKSDKS
jgi:ABC-type Fe3+-hydroxamate transport system substrate-binding protein